MFGLEWEDNEESGTVGEDVLADANGLQQSLEWGSISNVDGSSGGVFGTPYLIEACERNLLESVKVLIENSANPNITHAEGNSPLHVLLKPFRDEAIPIVHYLIRNKGDIVQQNCQSIPALALCPPNKLSIFQSSLQERFESDPEYFYSSKDTFMKGVRAGIRHNLEYVRLMQRFYDFDLESYLETMNTQNLYIDCVTNQNRDTFNLLISKNIGNVNAIASGSGFSALHHAAAMGSLDMARLLCSHPNVDVNIFQNESPLHMAALNGHSEIIGELLRANADPTMKTTFSNNSTGGREYKEDTALHLAIRNGHLASVKVLLQEEGNLHLLVLPNHWGNIPLHIAVMKEHIDIIEFVLRRQAAQQINFVNQNQETALHYAYRYCKQKDTVIDILVSHGADESLSNHKGEIPAQIRAKGNSDFKGPGRGNRLRSSQSRRKKNNNRNRKQKNKANEQPQKKVNEPAVPLQGSQEDDDSKLCVICFENAKNCLLKPCRHIATCMECSQLVHECPICRSQITKKSKVFIA